MNLPAVRSFTDARVARRAASRGSGARRRGAPSGAPRRHGQRQGSRGASRGGNQCGLRKYIREFFLRFGGAQTVTFHDHPRHSNTLPRDPSLRKVMDVLHKNLKKQREQ